MERILLTSSSTALVVTHGEVAVVTPILWVVNLSFREVRKSTNAQRWPAAKQSNVQGKPPRRQSAMTGLAGAR